jgi:hypothetical protein
MQTRTASKGLKATCKAGHEWTGEIEIENGWKWFMYRDPHGSLYQSKEIPAYRIHLNNSCLISVNGKQAIFPISKLDEVNAVIKKGE